MNCPVCKSVSLHMRELEKGLPVSGCSNCLGGWMRAGDYMEWLEKYESGEGIVFTVNGDAAGGASTDGDNDSAYAVVDVKQAKLCPDCGRIMLKYKVSRELDFYLDRCSACNGVWLDRNEWLALKRSGLFDKVPSIFTEGWQEKLRMEVMRFNFDRKYLAKFGERDYDALKEIRAWLDAHSNKSDMLAFLLDDDPYSV